MVMNFSSVKINGNLRNRFWKGKWQFRKNKSLNIRAHYPIGLLVYNKASRGIAKGAKLVNLIGFNSFEKWIKDVHKELN